VIENAKRHKGMILLQKHQRKLLTKSQKVDLVGYGGENDRTGLFIASVGHTSGRSFQDVRTRGPRESA
jgi:hypothetical protein